jgi:drug/metabolite transporter (DMT)-like permease
MALSAFLFAVMAAVAKLLGKRISTQEVILVRGLLNGLFTIWWLRRANASWLGQRPWLLFLRGLLGYTALSCYFWSVSRQPLATAVLLQQVHPVFTALLAIWFLQEKPGARFIPACILGLAGVWLIAPHSASSGQGGPLPFLVGLLGAVLAAGAYVAVRQASRTEQESTIVFWFSLTMVPFSALGTIVAGPVWPSPSEWGWLLLVGATGQGGQFYLTRGLARVPAGRATLANSLTIAFGALLGWIVFQEPIGLREVAGGLAIIAAVLLAGSGKRDVLTTGEEPSP